MCLIAEIEFHLEGLDDVARYVVLNRENIVQVAVVAIRPHVPTIGYVDKLGRDTNLVGGFANTSFKSLLSG